MMCQSRLSGAAARVFWSTLPQSRFRAREASRRAKIAARRARPSTRRTVGRLGRQEIAALRHPGRCPGLRERLGLRPEHRRNTPERNHPPTCSRFSSTEAEFFHALLGFRGRHTERACYLPCRRRLRSILQGTAADAQRTPSAGVNWPSPPPRRIIPWHLFPRKMSRPAPPP